MRAIGCMTDHLPLRRISWTLTLSLLLLCLGLPGQAHPVEQTTAEQAPRIMTGFVHQSKEGPASQVIETAEQMAAFVSCIPDVLPHKRQPPPPHPDPLRHDFSLDFSKEILVVAVHHDTISAFPEYKETFASPDERVVRFDVPEPPPEARPYGWGVYTAIILPKAGAPPKLQLNPVPSEP